MSMHFSRRSLLRHSDGTPFDAAAPMTPGQAQRLNSLSARVGLPAGGLTQLQAQKRIAAFEEILGL